MINTSSQAIKQYDLSHTDNIFLDCGAYSMKATPINYPFERYFAWIETFRDHNLKYVATVDFIGKVEDTVFGLIECIDHDNSIPWIPVLQGNTINDYCLNAQLYKDYGISTDTIAIGNLKTKSVFEIMTILDFFKSSKIHAFGLRIDQFSRPNIWHNIDSTDSGTWKSRPKTTAQKYKQLAQFKSRLKDLTCNYSNQTTLT